LPARFLDNVDEFSSLTVVNHILCPLHAFPFQVLSHVEPISGILIITLAIHEDLPIPLSIPVSCLLGCHCLTSYYWFRPPWFAFCCVRRA